MELKLLDSSMTTQGILDTFTSLIWKEKYYGCGDFEFVSPSVLEVGNAIASYRFFGLAESDRIMVLDSMEIKADLEAGDKITIRGRSAEILLDKRIIWNRTVLTGNLQNAIEQLLNENVISPSDSLRTISLITYEASTDPLVTSLEIEAQFDPGTSLYEAIVSICQSRNISFKMVFNGVDKLVFKLYSGADRSYDQTENDFIVFSPEFDNLLKADYVENAAGFRTTTLVVGEGINFDQHSVVVELSEGLSGLNRSEVYSDASSISKTPNGELITYEEYIAQLQEFGMAVLTATIPTQDLQGEIDPLVPVYTYGVDYFMGDIVQVADSYGHESKSRVMELIFSEDENGVKIYPTFSTIS